MLARNLEREHLSTSNPGGEIRPLQELENTIFYNQPIELSRYLKTDTRLRKIGFDTLAEMKRFVMDINVGVSLGKSLPKAVEDSLEVFESHIGAYNREFIEQNPLLPHLNRIGIWQGEERMLGNNGRPVLDAVSDEERMGSVWRVSQKIEQFILGAENNSVIVLMSSQGESGYLDEDGCDIPHLNSQTMVFWKNGKGQLKGVTLITDLTVDQAEKVMEILGAPANFLSKKGTEMQRVINILENPAMFSYVQSLKNPFEYVFDQILEVRGNNDIELKQKNGRPETRPVSKIKRDLAKFDTILSLSLIKSRFRQYVLENAENINDQTVQQMIVNLSEEAIVSLGMDYLKKHSQTIKFSQGSSNVSYMQNNYSALDYDRRFAIAVTFLESRAGCPSKVGSGLRALSGISSGSSGLAVLEGKGGKCDKCTRSADGHYHCPSCNAPYEDESDRSPGNYTPSCGCGYVFGCGNSAEADNSEEKEEGYELAKAA